MIAAFALLLVLHWLIHLLGAAMAFGWAELPQLTRPIAPLVGVQWIGASLLSLGTAVSLFVWPRGWWLIGACAVAVSMAVIIPSWSDAKFGALANAIIIVGVGFGVLSNGPFSLRAEYERDVARLLPRDDAVPPITDADLAHLPVPVQRYLRITGVIGQPRVRSLRVRMHGRIRSGHEARWMPFLQSSTTSSTNRRVCFI